MRAYASHNRRSMPPPKKALSPASRAKADKRNEREKTKRAAIAAASGGAKSAKKKRKMADLTEEETPVSGGGSSVSGGGSSCTWKRSGDLMFALLEEKQKGHFEAEKLALAEEAARFYKRGCELQNKYMEYLEWADAEKTKKIEVLKKKYQDVLDLNTKEYEEAQQEVTENLDAHLTCLDHYVDLWYLCCGKIMDTQEPINHTKLLRKWGYKFKHFL